jgi:actin-related protein 2
VVCDNGTGFVKCGYGGENFPRHVFQSMIGRPMLRAEDAELDSKTKLKEIMIGDEAAAARQYLEIKYPVENGKITDWNDMELLWKHTFHDVMGLCGKDYNCEGFKILLTEAPLNPEANQVKMLEVMFETFHFDEMQVQTQAMLTLYAQGLMTGVVLDSGDGVSHTVGVFEGFVPTHLTKRLDVAGRVTTRYLCDLLRRRGYSLNSTADLETVREIKEELCFVAYDIEAARKLAQETTVLLKEYKLPDGSIIKLGGERFEAAEAMFNPQLVDVSSPGVAEMLHQLVEDSDIDMHIPLYSHIVLSGGSTMYPGFPTRLEKDLTQLYLKNVLGGNKRGLRVRALRACVCACVCACTPFCGAWLTAGLPWLGCGACPPVISLVWLLRCDLCLPNLVLSRVSVSSAYVRHLRQKFKLHIEDPPRRKNLVFLGASVLGNIMEGRPDFWVTQAEYKEQGAKVAAKRFSRG